MRDKKLSHFFKFHLCLFRNSFWNKLPGRSLTSVFCNLCHIEWNTPQNNVVIYSLWGRKFSEPWLKTFHFVLPNSAIYGSGHKDSVMLDLCIMGDYYKILFQPLQMVLQTYHEAFLIIYWWRSWLIFRLSFWISSNNGGPSTYLWRRPMFDDCHVSSKNSVFHSMGTFFDWKWNTVLSHLCPYEWVDLLCKFFWRAGPLFLCEGGLQPKNWNPK